VSRTDNYRILSGVPLSKSTDPTLVLFEEKGAYLHGHFRLTSGLHSPEYLQCAKILQYPDIAERLGQQLAASIRSLTGATPIPVVASPAIGGLIIGHEVARALGARFLFTERGADGKMSLRRGFEVEPGEVAVVVEDVVTTGGSSREVVEILQQHGANMVAAASLIDRSGGQADLGVRRVALSTLSVKTWAPEICPLCRAGSPAVKPGSRNAG
jgi:orotate phosphoribosyltransferase